MASLLNLPKGAQYGGVFYEMNTDFSVWLGFENAVYTRDAEKITRVIAKIYKGFKLPPDIEAAVSAAAEFYSGESEKKNNSRKGTEKRIYDYEFDFDFIYAAFFEEYGIDLTKEKMHWYKFKALFAALSEKTRIMQIISYRSINPAGIKDGEKRRHIQRMKDIYRLPDLRSESRREEDTIAVLEKFFEG